VRVGFGYAESFNPGYLEPFGKQDSSVGKKLGESIDHRFEPHYWRDVFLVRALSKPLASPW